MLSAHELPTYAPPKEATKRTWQEKTTYHGTTSVRSILIAQITYSRSIHALLLCFDTALFENAKALDHALNALG